MYITFGRFRAPAARLNLVHVQSSSYAIHIPYMHLEGGRYNGKRYTRYLASVPYSLYSLANTSEFQPRVGTNVLVPTAEINLYSLPSGIRVVLPLSTVEVALF